MKDDANFEAIKNYFEDKLTTYGATPHGVDWNGPAAQELRFEQLLKVVDFSRPFSILDYGCGVGALADTLRRRGASFSYTGYDVLPSMVARGRELHSGWEACRFTSRETELEEADYVVESGIFNIRLEASQEAWTDYVLKTLERMNALARRGLAFNMLTKYSDAEYMKANLYYADPGFFFDTCKRLFAKNVALLHDYGLYDFTILVRKEL